MNSKPDSGASNLKPSSPSKTSQAASTPLPNPKPKPSFDSRLLSDSEVESLRAGIREAAALYGVTPV
ncbi:MAG: hypothetical protein M3R15_19595 [Acidobacteriota bacterium]|nr:hypothetical protein [Acidobacteriota bacterium]